MRSRAAAVATSVGLRPPCVATATAHSHPDRRAILTPVSFKAWGSLLAAKRGRGWKRFDRDRCADNARLALIGKQNEVSGRLHAVVWLAPCVFVETTHEVANRLYIATKGQWQAGDRAAPAERARLDSANHNDRKFRKVALPLLEGRDLALMKSLANMCGTSRIAQSLPVEY